MMATVNALDYERIRVINSEYDYRRIANQLKRDCRQFNVLGFDCEWVPDYGPVAMLQLATGRGDVYLIRTCKMERLPHDLIELLENEEIIKVGIDGWRDVAKIEEKYRVFTRGTLDLRFLAEKCKFSPRGLEHLAREHLGIQLDKGGGVNHYTWGNEWLPHSSQLYAANDAYVSIELFKHFMNLLQPGGSRNPLRIRCFDVLGENCIDKRYIYRSELDRSVVRAQSQRMYPEGLQPQSNNRRRTDETEKQSEGISGWGLAFVAAAALGGFLYYKSQQQK